MHEIVCTGCGRNLRVQADWVGKNIKCPQCSAVQLVGSPPPPAMGSAFPAPSSAPTPVSPPSPAGSFSQPGNPFEATSFRDSPFPGPNPPKDINPYAAPNVVPDLKEAFAGQWNRVPTGISEILERNWKLFMENIGVCLLSGLVMIGQGIVVSIGMNLLLAAAQATNELAVIIGAQIVAQIANFVISVFFQLGFTIFGLNLARRQNPSVGDLFAGGSYMLQGGVLWFLVTLAIYGILFVFMLPAIGLVISREEEAALAAAVVGFVVAFPVLMYITLTWFIATPMLVDKNLNCIEALKCSAEYMQGSRLSAFLALLVFGALGVLFIVVTCGIGVLAYLPLVYLLPIIVYLSVTGQPMPGIKSATLPVYRPPTGPIGPSPFSPPGT